MTFFLLFSLLTSCLTCQIYEDQDEWLIGCMYAVGKKSPLNETLPSSIVVLFRCSILVTKELTITLWWKPVFLSQIDSNSAHVCLYTVTYAKNAR